MTGNDVPQRTDHLASLLTHDADELDRSVTLTLSFADYCAIKSVLQCTDLMAKIHAQGASDGRSREWTHRYLDNVDESLATLERVAEGLAERLGGLEKRLDAQGALTTLAFREIRELQDRRLCRWCGCWFDKRGIRQHVRACQAKSER